MNPVNQEHIEAAQLAADQERAKFIATLPPDQQKQFNAVLKAVNSLTKAGVLFYLFPYLPALSSPKKWAVWQWNSSSFLIDYGPDGKPTEAQNSQTGRFHEAFFATLFSVFQGMFNGNSVQEKLAYIPFLFHHCLVKTNEYLNQEEPTKND